MERARQAWPRLFPALTHSPARQKARALCGAKSRAMSADLVARLERAVRPLMKSRAWQAAGEFRFAMLEGLRARPLFASFMGADGGMPALAIFLDESAVAALMQEANPPARLPIVVVTLPTAS